MIPDAWRTKILYHGFRGLDIFDILHVSLNSSWGRTRTRTVPGVLSQDLGSQIMITNKHLTLIFRNGIKRRSLRLDFRKFEILDLKTYRVDSIDNWKFHFAKLKNPWKCTGSEQAAESICFRHRRYNVNLSCSNDSRPIYRWNFFTLKGA